MYPINAPQHSSLSSSSIKRHCKGNSTWLSCIIQLIGYIIAVLSFSAILSTWPLPPDMTSPTFIHCINMIKWFIVLVPFKYFLLILDPSLIMLNCQNRVQNKLCRWRLSLFCLVIFLPHNMSDLNKDTAKVIIWTIFKLMSNSKF